MIMRPLETSIKRTLAFSSDKKLKRRFMLVHHPIVANLRWGLLLEELDKLAEDVALEYMGQFNEDARVVTAAIDDVMLRTPADINKDLNLRARINYVGRSSMEVGIRLDQDAASLASCYFTMVARIGGGDEAKSVAVGPLNYIEPIEKDRYNAAIERRKTYRNQINELKEPPHKDEYKMLRQLHTAQEKEDFNGLLAGRLTLNS